MDRLLTPNEQPNIPQDAFSIYDWKTALQTESHINEVKKLQDAKTAHLVAQEIFKELEEQFGLYSDGKNGKLELDMIVIKPGDYYSTEDAMEKYKAFKTKWGVE